MVQIAQAALGDRPEAVLLDQWYVISLNEAVELRRWHRQEAANAGEPDLLLPPSWFPILRSTGAPFMCLQTDRELRRLLLW